MQVINAERVVQLPIRVICLLICKNKMENKQGRRGGFVEWGKGVRE